MYSSSVYSCHLYLISSTSVVFTFLSFIMPILTWNVSFTSPVFKKRWLVFPTLLFYSISLHCSLKKALFSLLAILWNSAFSWVCLSLYPLLLFLAHFSRSVMSDSLWPMDCSIPGFPVHYQFLEFLKLMSIESVMLPNHLILYCPLLLLPSIFPSITVFSKESVLHIRWPKYWSFSISPFNEYSGLISFRMDWLDLLAVQGTLKSLFQHHSSKPSILRRSAFFAVQLSHPQEKP